MSLSHSGRGREWRSPPPRDVAVISNGSGEFALLDRTGNVTSWCLPDGNGVPLIHELYDAPWRTAFRLGLDDKRFPINRRLEDTSHTHVSTWINSTGRASGRDCVLGSPLDPDGGGQVARLLTCEQGTVNADLDLQLRYGFRGEELVQWTVPTSGRTRSRPGFMELTATVGSMRLLLATNMQLELDKDGSSVTGRLRLTAKQSAFVWIGWRDHTSPVTVKAVKKLLKESERGWLKWAQSLRIPDDDSASTVLECAIRLRGLGHRSGAYYAASSRGIPEDAPETEPKVRTWDYLFDWLRDGGESVNTLHRLGDTTAVPARVRWYRSIPDFGRNTKIMYGPNGEDVALLGEHIVEELGHRGAIFRFGNGAGDQDQGDKCFYPLRDQWHEATRRQFDLDLTEGLADQAAAICFTPCSGIWEVRRENSDELVVYSSAQILNGQALYFASEIFRMAGMESKARKYAEMAKEVKRWVLDNCVQDGVIVAAPNLHVLDASVLLAFLRAEDMFDLNDDADRELVRRTVLAIDRPQTEPARFRGLRIGNGHVRYHTDEFNDGISLEKEAMFNNVTGWVAENLLRLGMLERSEAVMQELLDGRNDLGMWSEERTPDGVHLGNVNQAYVYQTVCNFFLERAAVKAALGRLSKAAAA